MKILAAANTQSDALTAAFAKVPREHFLGPASQKRSGCRTMEPRIETKLGPTVRYRYQFAGDTFKGRRITFAAVTTTPHGIVD